jgi:hypothetical protein
VTSDATRRVRRMNLLGMTRHMGLRYQEIGFLVAGIGGVLLAFGNAVPFGKRGGGVLGGLAIAIGMVLAVIGVHYGGRL